MFIRVKSTPNSPRKSIQIVESYREGLRVRQRIAHHVGIASDEKEIEQLKALACNVIIEIKKKKLAESDQPSFNFNEHPDDLTEMLKIETEKQKGRKARKKIEDILPVEKVTLSDIVEEKRIVEGVDEVLSPFYDKLGFNQLLSSKKANQRLKSLILARVVEPHSKRKLHKKLINQYDQTYSLDAIYQLMDKLYPKIDLMKSQVFHRTQSLFPSGISLMLFDVTTLYFESVETDELREFGYSKDHRFNTTQVVLALATNEKGLPLGYELFSGKTAEVTTLCLAIEKWRTFLPIESICFVGDRAMFSEGNLKMLEEKGYSYIVAAKLKSLNSKIQSDILDSSRYELNNTAEFELKHRRLIVNHSESRDFHDKKKRQTLLDKVNKTLKNTKKTDRLISNSAIKKYTTTSGQSQTQIDDQKIQQEERWDGLHGVITNIRDEKADAILKRYRNLWVIEESFRINKHTLRMRPIFHWKKQRIETHIAICYMSFALLRHLQYEVALTQKVSPETLIAELQKVEASIFIHKETQDRYRVPSVFSQTAQKIYRAVGLKRSLDATIYQP